MKVQYFGQKPSRLRSHFIPHSEVKKQIFTLQLSFEMKQDFSFQQYRIRDYALLLKHTHTYVLAIPDKI